MSLENHLRRRFKEKFVEEKTEGVSVKEFKNFYKLNKSFFSFEKFVELLYTPTCSSSLGFVRALFGLMMVIDIPDERGLWNIDVKFGDSMRCHFPLFDWLSPLSLEYMGLLYCIMWLGALGICLGFKFHISCLMFIFPYWYIYLLDKTVWNNHSYLYGLVAVLFTFTQANHSCSLDAIINPKIRNRAVPLWNYAIIRFQFFLLYFYAGVKKFDPDWIGGYSMTSLGLHWVFNPFRLVLNNEQIDFWIIHIFGFLFDLTVGFFLLIDKTRPVAIVFATAFHLMNSCMFRIGQFPYVCLVTTPIFCNYDWPDQLKKVMYEILKKPNDPCEKEKLENSMEKLRSQPRDVTWRHKMTCYLLILYMGIQIFLPYSHFLTQGYNNWTNGLYGYSWDMMVQNWDSDVIVIRVLDNESKKEYFLDPEAWVGNTRYSKHGDMLIQYAKCIKKNLSSPKISSTQDVRIRQPFNDISIYVDVWCSLNGRFQQRMFDPKQDLLRAEWSPFKKISWLMPLLSELTPWRKSMAEMENEIYKWSNYSDVLFVADFPGLHLENFINPDFTNVTLTVLQGVVILEVFNQQNSEAHNITLFKGDYSKIKEGTFHKVYTVSEQPSCYMYTYNNFSIKKLTDQAKDENRLGSIVNHNIFVDNFYIRVGKLRTSLQKLYTILKRLILSTIFNQKSN